MKANTKTPVMEMISQDITTKEFLELAASQMKLSAKNQAILEKITLGMQMFDTNQSWNKVELSRLLLGSGLNVRQAAYLLNCDTGDITSNNNPRLSLGDTPKHPWTIKTLRQSEKYNKGFSDEELEAISVKFPRAKEFQDVLLRH